MRLFQSRRENYTVEAGPFTGARQHLFGRITFVKTSLYAEVALDMNVKELSDRLFTYEIPEQLRADVFIGSQVLVPFGKQELVAAWVVSLKEGNGADDIKTKAISEVLDNEPLFDRNYIDFLYWIAEYYAATISDVLAAAIPSELVPRWRRLVTAGESSLLSAQMEAQLLTSEEKSLLDFIRSRPKALMVRTLKERSGMTARQFYKALSRLKSEGLIFYLQEIEESTKPRTVLAVMATGQTGGTKRHEEILTVLSKHSGCLPLAELVKLVGAAPTTIRKMESLGLVTIFQQEAIRDPLKDASTSTSARPQLTETQQAAFDTLSAAASTVWNEEASDGVPWLLHGVTGSGKTEVYLRMIEQALAAGRTAMLLVPEISLTPQLAQRLTGRFPGLVAVWHSALSAGERYDTWRRLEAGELKVLLGARSAILLRMNELGLIILDEEHDNSYKQTSPSPRYSARTLAMERGRRENSLVLFGSATPDAVTFSDATRTGRVVELPGRVFNQTLPESIIVDMRHEFSMGNKGIFSDRLKLEMSRCLERREQMILLINRRGFANHIFCRACGHVLKCKNCSVSLVYHNSSNFTDRDRQHAQATMFGGTFTCHHCAFTRGSTEICPACDAPFLRQSGVGTQKVEAEVMQLFPEARTLRLDSDVTARKGAYQEIFKAFAEGEGDILIGTQMIAKGIDIHKVTLVGVLTADAVFNLPDYRSLERGFQLLTQVSGRAGRGDRPGRVILQTYNPELPALDLARRQDYAAFIATELESREHFSYPPISQLIRVVVSGEQPRFVEAASDQLCEAISVYLDDFFSADSIKLLGPAPCLIEKIKNMHRYQILFKNLAGDEGRKVVTAFLKSYHTTQPVRITVDVDPTDLV